MISFYDLLPNTTLRNVTWEFNFHACMKPTQLNDSIPGRRKDNWGEGLIRGSGGMFPHANLDSESASEAF